MIIWVNRIQLVCTWNLPHEMVDSPSYSVEDGSDEIGGVIHELLSRFIRGTSRSPFSKVTPKWKIVLWISTLCIENIGLNYYFL